MKREIKNKLIKKAKEVREKAYNPYSNFAVGAALLTEDDKVFTGCNVENVSYGLTVCAERTAIFNAVTAGYTKFKALAVVADTRQPVAPCGACRQVLAEFGDSIKVIMLNMNGDENILKISDLLPLAFNQEDIHEL